MGRTTTWRYDVQGRLVAKQFPDGSKMAKIHWKAIQSADAPACVDIRFDNTLLYLAPRHFGVRQESLLAREFRRLLHVAF